MDNLNQDKIIEIIGKLSEEKQKAVCAFINHFDLFDEMTNDGSITNENFQIHMDKARKRNDYLAVLILLFAKDKIEKQE